MFFGSSELVITTSNLIEQIDDEATWAQITNWLATVTRQQDRLSLRDIEAIEHGYWDYPERTFINGHPRTPCLIVKCPLDIEAVIWGSTIKSNVRDGL